MPTGRPTPSSARRCRTRARPCTSPATRSTPTTSSFRQSGVLHAHPVQAPHAHARITRLDTRPGLAVPGVVRVLTKADVPGLNDSGVKHDEPLFPDEVMYHGHAVCWVLGETLEAARRGAADGRGRLRAAAGSADARPRRSSSRASRAPGRCWRAATSDTGFAGGPARLRGRARARRARSTSTWRPSAALASDRRGRPGVRAVQHPAPHRDPGDHRPRARRTEPPGHRAVPADGRRVRRQGDAAARPRRGGRPGRHAHGQTRAAAAHPPAGHDDDRQAARLPRHLAGRASTTRAGSPRWRPPSPRTAAGASTSPSRCSPAPCATSTTPTGSRTCACTGGSRGPTRPRRRPSAASAARRGCSSSRTSSAAARRCSASRPRSCAAATSTPRARPRRTARPSATPSGWSPPGSR